jgi:8-oxo-dGTP pyrophosphatase MutT (NUDIX family)/ribosomal protein S18 acetylase RimI-like enzyme
VRFELVRERVAALPRELPAAPAILTPIRLDSAEALVQPDPFGRGRPAAVLVLLFPDAAGQARVLLTARASNVGAHAGEVSFPGGSADESDADPIATALREAAEEVGLDPAACGLRVTGALEVFALTVSGFRITPVVALAERRPECHPSPGEVARIVEAPVEAFLPDAPVELEERVIRERLIRYGVYPIEGERVWGATARMLGQLGALLARGLAEAEGPGAEAPQAQAAAIQAAPASGTETPLIRRAGPADVAAIDPFLQALGPELARALPPASDTLLTELGGAIVGLASWAPWERPRPKDQSRGFDGLALPDEHVAAELMLLAVAPGLRHRGIGRDLTDAIAEVARSAGCTRLLAWTLSDSAVHPSSVAARAFFRSNGFADLAVDRHCLSGGEDRLLLARTL